jgi:hypothetical protein
MVDTERPGRCVVVAAGALVVALLATGGCSGSRGPATGAPTTAPGTATSPTIPASGSPAPDVGGTDSAGPDVSRNPAGGSGAGGPTTTPRPPRPANPDDAVTDLAVTTTGLRLDRPVRGIRHGALTVRVQNKGPAPAWQLRLVVEVPESMSGEGDGWSGCTRLKSHKVGFPAYSVCDKGFVAAGQTVTFGLGMSSPAAQDGADSPVSRWVVNVWSMDANGEPYRDGNSEDNRKIFSVFRA